MTDHSTGGPLPPDRIDLPVYRAVEGPDTPIGSTVYAWGPAGPDSVRTNLGTGRLIGWLKRERAYSQIEGRYEGTAYFNIAEHWHRATDRNDVALAVVEGPDGRYLPSYPRCPDCGVRGRRQEGQSGTRVRSVPVGRTGPRTRLARVRRMREQVHRHAVRRRARGSSRGDGLVNLDGRLIRHRDGFMSLAR